MKYLLHDLFEGNFPVSQPFGVKHWRYLSVGLLGHEGVDWALPVGIKLLNPFPGGQVLRTGWDKAYGYFVVMWDAKQLCAVWFCHMSKINVRGGQILKVGATIGLSGRSGNVTGAHLHAGFVETDKYANRKNKLNGYQGFLNILDKNLVRWKLSR